MIDVERRRAVAVAAAGFATFLNLYTPQAILPDIARAFGVELTRGGLALTLPLLAVAVVAPVAGAVSDRLGRKRVIVGAAAVLLAPTLLVAGATSFEALLFWRFAQGLLLPFIFAVTVAYVGEECAGPAAIRVTGLYASGTIVGGFSGRFLAGVVADAAGWRMAFVALGLLTAAAVALIAAWLPREQKFTPMHGGLGVTLAAYAGHLRNPPLLATCAVGFGMLFSLVAAFTYINYRLALPPYSLGPSALGAVFGVYLFGAVAAPLAARVAARIGRRRTVAGGVAFGLCGLLLTLAPSLAAIVAGLALVCVALFACQALALSFIGVAARGAKSAAVGLYVAIYYVGGAIGGIAPNGLWRIGGWPPVAGLIGAVMIAMAAVAVKFWPAHQPV